MKERATIICRRGDRILLVARSNARWVLPGGKPHRGELLRDAARRELAEESGLVCGNARYLFRIAGSHKLHHVFLGDVPPDAVAHPAHEIAHCAWIDRQTLASVDCSRPTLLIVDLAFDRIRRPCHEPQLVLTDMLADVAT
ncbi:NUDIX domain-containing protein [Burkholderia sp. JSH-S8]|nr:NUDIX domain-containing protein [Burkholderia sp. JSH-S8]